MKKPLKLIKKPVPPVNDDEAALAIGREVLRLARAQHGKFMLHVWFTGQGVQANYSCDMKSWGVSIKRRAQDAILDVLKRR